MDERQKGYAEWRERLLQNLLKVVFLIGAIELLMLFYLKAQKQEVLQTVPYLIKYVLTPTLLNMLVLLAGWGLIRSSKVKELWKDEILLYCIAAVCFILSYIHVRFSITAGLYMVPILISVVYGSIRTTKRVTMVCLALAVISLIIPGYDPKICAEDYFMNKVLAVFLIIGGYLLGKVMLLYVKDRNEELRKSTAERLQLQENLKRDAMTGLFNHTEFYRYLEECLQREQPALHIAVIDIDDFKKVNDTYGHERGNDVLIELSGLLEEGCGRDSHISRYGGEEFAVVFHDKTLEEVCNRMESIRKRLESVMLAGMPVTVSISVGIAAYEKGMTAQMLFEKADEAMYLAKRSGKNRIQTL